MGGRRKAFRGKRTVGKGRRQDRVWQVWGLREEQQVASCCSPVFGITAMLLGLDYSADSDGWNVCSTGRAQKTKMGKQVQEPGCPSRCYLSPRQRRTHCIPPLAAMASGSKTPGVPGMVQWFTCFEQGQTVAPGPSSPHPHITTDQNST